MAEKVEFLRGLEKLGLICELETEESDKET